MGINTGGSAFPVNTTNVHASGACFPHEGMTLRDYIATKAMLIGFKIYDTGYGPDEVSAENIAKFAYQMADAMIKESEMINRE